MENDEKKQQELQDDEFIDSLLNEDEDKDESKDSEKKTESQDGAGEPSSDSKDKGKDEQLSEEEQRQKNKDAEAARKRREAEAKAKEEAEKKAKEEKQKEADSKAEKERKDKEQRSANESKLGEQLAEFKRKYPKVDLGELDNDKSFKKYIDGKLLGKKDFTSLYEEYVDFRSEITQSDRESVEKNHRKAQSSSGPAKSGSTESTDIYSEQELREMAAKLPFLHGKKEDEVREKLLRSAEYYEKNTKT